MPNRYAKHTLWKLRNTIPIAILIADILDIPSKTEGTYFRFLCPLCSGFDTATNPKTNLARCFTCRKNFNTIDLTMTVKRQHFREAVQFLQAIRKVDTNKLCADIAASWARRHQPI
jgi:hypothetical protein